MPIVTVTATHAIMVAPVDLALMATSVTVLVDLPENIANMTRMMNACQIPALTMAPA